MADKVIWNEKNELVDAERNKAAKRAASDALGETKPEADKSIVTFGSPEEAQATESQTSDPMTTPRPVTEEVAAPAPKPAPPPTTVSGAPDAQPRDSE